MQLMPVFPRLDMAHDIDSGFYLNFLADLFRSLLRCDKSIQTATHLFREDYRHVQGKEEARDATPHLRYCGHSLQEHAARYASLMLQFLEITTH